MLRLGHLKVLVNVAVEAGGSRYRVERTTAELLTSKVTVPSEEMKALTEYLYKKKLCLIRSTDPQGHDNSLQEGAEREIRYPDLAIERHSDGTLRLTNRNQLAQTVDVWWQDRWLASPNVPSKVGAVTVSAKSGSKTGLSHIVDWAEATGFISSTAQATPEGQLLAKLDGKYQGSSWIGNPYILGMDRILIGSVVLSLDLDLFSRLITALHATTWPLKKRDAASLFADTVERLVDEAESANHLTVRQRFHLTEQLRELERAARGKHGDVGGASTTWHRAASRLETYVDLGFLTKASGDHCYKFEYTYFPTALLSSTSESLRSESDPLDWLETHVVSCLLGRETRQEPIGIEEMREPLLRVLETMRSPTTSYPIGTVALGLASLLADSGDPISIRAARRGLEELPRSHPGLAHLSRGTSGQRAEYISLDLGKI